jgi:Ca2+-binding RTX toxin-like protein
MTRVGLTALAVCAALVLPASAPAATVGVEELPGDPPGSTDPQQAKLEFVAAPGEANRLTVSVADEDGDFFDLRLVDGGAPIQPGPGCSGGGAAGTPVLCKVRKPTVGDNYTCWKGCYAAPGTAWRLNLSFALGDGGSRLDTTALPGSVNNKGGDFFPSTSIEVTVAPGAGDDTVLTGPGPDEVESSGGADLVRTGAGFDVFRAGPVPDGPDDVDLGDAYEDTIDFSERRGGVRYEPNGQADDGASGEGDNLGPAGNVRGGAGRDALFSARGDILVYGARIAGGSGDDFILGSARNDLLSGGQGDDELVGRAGNDALKDPARYGGNGRSGDDVADGGPGDDVIELGRGEDDALGGPGRDRIVLGRDADTGKGGPGGDVLLGGEGTDEIEAGPGNDRLTGDTGSDWLFGGAGEDRIAAGMIVFRLWSYRTFLHSPGPLEHWTDEVGCGTGRDMVRAGLDDTATGCETTLRAEPLEVRGFADGDRYSPPGIKISIRSPGTVRLEGRGLTPRARAVRRAYGAMTLPLYIDERARRTLLREGHVELRLRISYRGVEGREVSRVYPIDLWQGGEVEGSEPA